MRAFMTGATGFLGTHVVQQLAQRGGWDITAMVRPNSDTRILDGIGSVDIRHGDMLDVGSLQKCIPEGVDAVFHMAASVGLLPHRQEKSRLDINRRGTANVVDVCLEKNVGRFIYTSTVLSYDFHACRPLTESAPKNLWCDDPYIKSKRMADEEVDRGLALGLDAVYLHPAALFGAYDKQTWSKVFLEVERGLPLPFAPPAGGTICHARPVAAAHVTAVERGKRGEHYILGGCDATWLEVLQEVANIMGKKGPKYRLPTFFFKAYGWSEFLISSALGREPTFSPHIINLLSEEIYCDSSKAMRELGYEPSPMRTMLVDCYQWMLDEGMLDRPAAAGAVRQSSAKVP